MNKHLGKNDLDFACLASIHTVLNLFCALHTLKSFFFFIDLVLFYYVGVLSLCINPKASLPFRCFFNCEPSDRKNRSENFAVKTKDFYKIIEELYSFLALVFAWTFSGFYSSTQN